MIDMYTFLDSIVSETLKYTRENKDSEKEVIDLTFEEIKEGNANES